MLTGEATVDTTTFDEIPPGTHILTWTGATNGNWDTSTLNWLTTNGTPTVFAQSDYVSDYVTFDDTAIGVTTINLTTNLMPSGLTVSNSTKTYTFAGPGQILGYTGLTKTGPGALVLTGSNAYSGGTIVSNGTLLVNNTSGSGTGTGEIYVASVATLGGRGIIGGPVTFCNGGTLTPGDGVGTLTISNSLTLSSDSCLDYELGTNSDQVVVNGNLGLGNSTLNVTNSGGFGTGAYVLFTHTNTVTAPSGTITVGTLPSGFTAMVSNDVPNARVLLVVDALVGDPWPAWIAHYFPGDGPNAAATADPDADGMINTNECLAGFDPTNNAAYLHIISVTKSGTNVTITYLGANGDNTYSGGPTSRTNVLEFTTGAANGSYSNNFASTGQTNILSGGTGLGTVTGFVDTNGTSGATRYYRVRVLVP